MTMDLWEAIRERRSIRQFKNTPVSRSLLQEILEAALRAPSAINTQPWECWVAGGRTVKQLTEALYAEAAKGAVPRSDFHLQETWTEACMARMRENGKGLFGVLGIDRQDKEKRRAFSLSMHRFFGAPQVIFICVDASLGIYSTFDCGSFAQTICLLATSRGLGTCMAHSGVNYPDLIRKYVPIPAEKKILLALYIGYPDPEAPVNSFRSKREPLENVVHWQDLG